MSENEKIEWFKILPTTVGVALGLLVAGYFGYIWLTMNTNTRLNKSHEERISKYEKIIEDMKYSAITRVETGTCAAKRNELAYKEKSELRTSTCKIVFTPPFKTNPSVSAGFSEIDTSKEGVAPGLRLKVEVTNISNSTADINFSTWHHTDIHRAKVQWIAIGK